ncbi:MAG: TVP38/TMEM64 family protein [Oscillibacter sp.]|nr:TVP38/TMEM64 family protein [Oscillibacter sp.]
MPKKDWGKKILHSKTYKIIILCVWLIILGTCLLCRDRFSVESILQASPQNMLLAALFMLLLFALKSLSVFIYCGILFIASGIIFPLPAAILINFLGAAVMVSLPYWLGRQMGGELIDSIICKYPKTAFLRQLQMENELFLSFITRIINILPSDVLSLYMGASGISYGKYLPGSIAGMLLTIITFPIVGSSITDPTSPLFIASVAIQVVVTVASITGYALYLRKKSKS